MNANQLIILLNICTYHTIGYNNVLTMQFFRKNNCRLKITRIKKLEIKTNLYVKGLLNVSNVSK